MSIVNDSNVEFEPLRLTKLLRKYSETERIFEEFDCSNLEERRSYEMHDILRGQTWRKIYKVMKEEAVSQVSFRTSVEHLSQLLVLYSEGSPFMNEELLILLIRIFLDESPVKMYILLNLFKAPPDLHEIMKAVQNLLQCLPDYTKLFLKRSRNCNEQLKRNEPLLIKEMTKPDISLLWDIDVFNSSKSQTNKLPHTIISNDKCQIHETQKISDNSIYYTQVSNGLCEEINICISKFIGPESQSVKMHTQSVHCELYADESDNILEEVTESELLTLLLKRQGNSLICFPFGYTKLHILLYYILQRNFHNDSKMVYIVFSKKIAVSITSFMNKELSNCGVVAFALTDDCQRQTSTFKQSKVIVTSLTTWENFCRKKDSGNIIRAVSDLIVDEITWLYENISPIVDDVILRSVLKLPSHSRIIAFSLVLKSSTELATRKILKYLTFKSSGCDFYTVKHKNTNAELSLKLVGINNKQEYHTTINSLFCISVLDRMKLNQKILILVENEKNAEIMISTLRGCAEINKIVFHSGFYSNNSTKFSSLELPPRTKYLLNYGYLLLPNNMNPSMRDAVSKVIMDGAYSVVVSTFDYSCFADVHVDAIIIVVLDPDNFSGSSITDVTSLSNFSRNTNNIEVINYIDTIEFIFRQLTGYHNSKRIVGDVVNRLNTEIVLGNIRSFDQASRWFQSTFSYVMNESLAVDVTINKCLNVLSKCDMIQFEDVNNFLSSEIGRAASYYNICYETMNYFTTSVTSTLNIPEVLHKIIKVLEKETKEVFMDEPNYLNNLAVDMHKLRFSVASNIQNAVGGLMRDYFHYKVPGLCKMFIINRMVQLVKALSEIMFCKRNYVMVYNCVKYWKMIDKLQFTPIKRVIMFDINVKVYISHNMYLQMEIMLLPKIFLFDNFPVGKPIRFWLWIENENYIYNYEYFHTSEDEMDSGLVMNYIFPISSVKASLSSYNIIIMSDSCPIYEQHFIAETSIDPTLHDEQILTCFTPTNGSYSNMGNVLRKLYEKKCWSTSFLQVFNVLYHTHDSMLVAGFSTYGEKTIIIEISVMKALEEKQDCKVIYTASEFSQICTMNNLLKRKWAQSIGVITGNYKKQLDLFEQSRIILVTWTHLNMLCQTDMIQSNFKNGKVSLLIIDGIQEMSAEIECAVIHSECKETNLRVIGLSVLPLGNITDVAHFLGVSECNTFNFNKSPFKAIVLSELNIQGFSEKLNKNWMPVMDEAVYKSILDHCPDKHPALIIVPSIQQLESTAKELIMWQEKSNEWLYLDISSINKIISTFTTEIIGQMLMHGIGLLFKKMSESDKRTVQELYASRKFKVLLTTEDMCKNVSLDTHLVILKGTKFCDKKKNIFHDLQPEDVSRLVGISSVSCPECTKKVVVILSQETKRQLYDNYFHGPVLVESQILNILPLLVIYKIVRGSFINMEDVTNFITDSFLALRIKSNKSLYIDGNYENDVFTNITDLAKSIVYKLQGDNYVTVDEVSENLNATVLGMILVNCNLEFKTTQLLLSELSPEIALRDMFSLICCAEEFKNITVPGVSSYMKSQIPNNMFANCSKNLSICAYKVSVLLQGYFFKCKSFPMKTIINEGILEIAQRVTQATASMCVQQEWIKSFLNSHKLLQMLNCECWTSGIWSLYSLPHMNRVIANELKDMKKALHMFYTDPKCLQNILAKNLTKSCVTEIFAVLDLYPKFEVSLYLYISEENNLLTVQQKSHETPHKLTVNVGNEYKIVIELTFSAVCKGTACIVLTENSVEKIVSFKKIQCMMTQTLMLPIKISRGSGERLYSLYTLFSSFVGADKRIDFTLHAVEPMC